MEVVALPPVVSPVMADLVPAEVAPAPTPLPPSPPAMAAEGLVAVVPLILILATLQRVGMVAMA
jgi:hypothetical protein